MCKFQSIWGEWFSFSYSLWSSCSVIQMNSGFWGNTWKKPSKKNNGEIGGVWKKWDLRNPWVRNDKLELPNLWKCFENIVPVKITTPIGNNSERELKRTNVNLAFLKIENKLWTIKKSSRNGKQKKKSSKLKIEKEKGAKRTKNEREDIARSKSRWKVENLSTESVSSSNQNWKKKKEQEEKCRFLILPRQLREENIVKINSDEETNVAHRKSASKRDWLFNRKCESRIDQMDDEDWRKEESWLCLWKKNQVGWNEPNMER